MKKIVFFGFLLIALSTVASAQQASGENFRRHRFSHKFNNAEITRPERLHLQADHYRYKRAEHRARRDGFVGPVERRRLHNMRKHNRHEMFRSKHNRLHRHHRVI
ncbi:MAG: hypothetical protein ABUT20_35635 [Bacteroidota bacterium]